MYPSLSVSAADQLRTSVIFIDAVSARLGRFADGSWPRSVLLDSSRMCLRYASISSADTYPSLSVSMTDQSRTSVAPATSRSLDLSGAPSAEPQPCSQLVPV